MLHDTKRVVGFTKARSALVKPETLAGGMIHSLWKLKAPRSGAIEFPSEWPSTCLEDSIRWPSPSEAGARPSQLSPQALS